MNNTKICIVGESAVGKDTIKEFLKNLGMKYGISTTTRLPRKEEDETFYHFKTTEEFMQDMRDDKFIEYDYFSGHHYGYEKSQLFADFFIVAGKGMDELKKYFEAHGFDVIIIGLTLGKGVRRNRMLSRGDHIESVKERMSEENKERFENDLEKADYVFENINSKETADEIFKIWKQGSNLLEQYKTIIKRLISNSKEKEQFQNMLSELYTIRGEKDLEEWNEKYKTIVNFILWTNSDLKRLSNKDIIK